MNLREQIEADLAVIETDLALTASDDAQYCTFRGKQLPCIPSSLTRGVTIDAHGNPVEIDLTLTIRRSHFLTIDSTLTTIDTTLVTIDNDTPIPLSGQTITFRSVDYRIITARLSAAQSHLTLTLGDDAA